MNDDRMQILKMVEAGKLSADEAARLLEAMENGGAAAAPSAPPRHPRVRVYDGRSDRRRAEVRLPVGLVSTILSIAGSFGVSNRDLEAVKAAIVKGERGRFVEVDADDGRVEIYLE